MKINASCTDPPLLHDPPVHLLCFVFFVFWKRDTENSQKIKERNVGGTVSGMLEQGPSWTDSIIEMSL
jgi:hypothetical protein